MTLSQRLICLILLFAPALQAAEPTIVASIKPVRWLVEALAPPGVAVTTLVPDGQSPHDYQLRPADVARIRQADLLVWIGPGMEPWLDAVADRRPAETTLALLPLSLHQHEDDHDSDHTDDAPGVVNDPHLWLDPLAMAEKAGLVARQMKQLYPANAAAIDNRLVDFRQQMQALDTELAATLAPVAATGFVVYHDGYQRLVQRHHLHQKAAIWHHESIPPGARERAALLQLLRSGDVQCLFYEPEHGADAIHGWLGDAAQGIRIVELDMMGAGEADYANFLRALAGKMTACLSVAITSSGMSQFSVASDGTS